MHLDTPISEVLKIGKTTALKLQRLGIFKALDLLYYFPFRYEDFSQIRTIKSLHEGEVVTVKCKVEIIANRRTPRQHKIITEALVSDESGSIRVVWFNQQYIVKNIAPGDEIYLSGTIKADMLGPQFLSPAYERVQKNSLHTARLVPMYPLTAGISQKQIRIIMQQVLPLAKMVGDWLPPTIQTEQQLMSLSQALEQIHYPDSVVRLQQATERLKFDELLLVQLQAELSRLQQRVVEAPALVFHEAEIKTFVSKLSFTLTKTQKIAAWEILQNIADKKPMNRLLSGDVGSGKTVVAAIALYNTVLSGYQGALMAPTEILATQHFESLTKMLPQLRICLLTRTHINCHLEQSERSLAHPITSEPEILQGGSIQDDNGVSGMKSAQEVSKKEMLEKINNGELQIIVGTHAILSEGVEFKKLGLVIVDEQHRFGVNQRKVMKEKGRGTHFLSMTATPIPRSLALMLYGDLDVSIINELPPGRKPIITKLVEPASRDRAYTFIRDQVKLGRQVFVICPLIEDSKIDSADKKSVLAEYKKLSEQIFPDLKVAYLHGRMKSEEKEQIMDDFKNNKTNILVATSVIEVGVNIPNATVMMIEGADRFGLAQLHQFRGRVGRSDHQSYCMLFSDTESRITRERLSYFVAHRDGFALAEKDLELRGPGEVYGTSQSGMMQLRLARLTDTAIIKKARSTAQSLAPRIQQFPTVLRKLQEWETVVHLE
jgi:ATP-dependent DNA helicase RecG